VLSDTDFHWVFSLTYLCITTAVPDLVVDVQALQESVNIDVAWLRHLRCAYEEKCLAESAASAWSSGADHHARRLLRFTTRIENRGLAPFRSNVPQSAWEWHSCHNHYHSMETFSTYKLLSRTSREQAAGHKASFCLEDTVCDKGLHKSFNCTNRGPQGISPNCYDIYKWNIDCQWIDVTDVPHGNFILRVTVNPERKVPESDYTNNIAKCWVYDYGNVAYTTDCHLDEV
ncbi:Protein-lysine 6-oxidase, partial [Exaiptasia diaphana]